MIYIGDTTDELTYGKDYPQYLYTSDQYYIANNYNKLLWYSNLLFVKNKDFRNYIIDDILT